MVTTAPEIVTTQPVISRRSAALAARDRAARDRAAHRMYDAEVALHIARQTGVDAWVRAAYDRLHEAIAQHSATVAATTRRRRRGARRYR
jgi:hypothetical protein